MNSVTFILNSDWEEQKSGAATFTRALLGGLDSGGVDYEVVKMREEDSPQRTQRAQRKRLYLQTDIAQQTELRRIKKGKENPPKGPSSVKIALGYMLELLRDCKHLWFNRKLLRHRLIVVNEFGCETIPIAARIIFPFNKIVALAHTHPGNGDYANHPIRRFVERMCYRSVSDIVFNSESLKNEWGNRIGMHGRSHVHSVIHYGIDSPNLSLPNDYPAKPDNCIDLVCASRLVRWKGHRELIAAFVGANGRSPVHDAPVQMRLILIGDGPELEICKKLAEGRDNIIFMGARDNGARYFNGADIGIQLSIEPEAFGLVFLEAMSRGKPVIGTKIGGIPEVVGDGGVLVESFDIDGAADAVVRFVQDEKMRQRLGECGKTRWRECFTLDRMVNEYMEYFGCTTHPSRYASYGGQAESTKITENKN